MNNKYSDHKKFHSSLNCHCHWNYPKPMGIRGYLFCSIDLLMFIYRIHSFVCLLSNSYFNLYNNRFMIDNKIHLSIFDYLFVTISFNEISLINDDDRDISLFFEIFIMILFHHHLLWISMILLLYGGFNQKNVLSIIIIIINTTMEFILVRNFLGNTVFSIYNQIILFRKTMAVWQW